MLNERRFELAMSAALMVGKSPISKTTLWSTHGRSRDGAVAGHRQTRFESADIEAEQTRVAAAMKYTD